ncbi:MAG: acyl-CoA dehydrogenase C-terminal domain-containing protein, partial [Pseudomonas sp.]
TAFAQALPAACAEFSAPLLAAVRNLDELTAWLLDRAQGNPRELGAAAVEYLQVFGYTFYAYLWARMAVVCQGHAAPEPFHHSKLGTAQFYFARLLPRIHSLSASVRAGSDSLYLLEAGQL